MMALHVLILAFLVQGSLAGLIRGERRRDRKEERGASNVRRRNLSVPSRCLEDPDAEDCRRWRGSDRQGVALPIEGSGTWRASFVEEYQKYDTNLLASSAPTKSWCYGNMARHFQNSPIGKYCHSEMPSVSSEPSVVPTVFSEGGSVGSESGVPSPTGQPEFDSPESTPPRLVPSMQPSSIPAIAPQTLVPTISSDCRVKLFWDDEFRWQESSEEVQWCMICGNPNDVMATQAGTTPPPPPADGASSPGLGQCEGDCSVDGDCQPGLYCFQRDPYQPVPGCEGKDLEGSKTDFCTSALSATPEAPECQEGDKLHIHECSRWWRSTYFEFVGAQKSETKDVYTTMIRVAGTDLCLERSSGLSVTLETCDYNGDGDLSLQRWIAGDLPLTCDSEEEVELVQPVDGTEFCLTTHHHPRHGEEIELYPCSVARRDHTSLWTPFT